MTNLTTSVALWLDTQGRFPLPLFFTLWIAWRDIWTRRTPNYLTLGIAVTGLAYQFNFHGQSGLLDGFLGMTIGVALLILPYIWGGMGAGDVKALSALGAWLGPWNTIYFFCYMAMAGGLISLGVLWWRGLLWVRIRRWWATFINFFLTRPGRSYPVPVLSGQTEGIPYGVAMALGMIILIGVRV